MTDLDRRRFLQLSLTASAVGTHALTSCASLPDHEPGRVLVQLFFAGGNDGLNTLVPIGDEAYARHRRSLRLPVADCLSIGDGLAFHPNLRGLADLLERGHLAAIQAVGYPEPSLSHFESARVWQSARVERSDDRSSGWIGRALEQSATGSMAASVGGSRTALALRGRRTEPFVLEHSGEFEQQLPVSVDVPLPQLDSPLAAHASSVFAQSRRAASALSRLAPADENSGYPQTRLAAQLRMVADVMRTDLPIVIYSEFGRRVAENASLGTDHGTAGPVFVVSPNVRAGVHGASPNLVDLDDGNLRAQVDFRSVYRCLLELGLPSQSALPGRVPPPIELF